MKHIVNMKKIVAVFLIVLLITVMFSACGGQNDGKTASVSLTELLEEIDTQIGVSNDGDQGLKVLTSEEELDRYYLIAAEDIKQFAAERTGDTDDYLEIVIVEAVDEAAADRIEIRLNSVLDSKRSNANSYLPETAKMFDDAQIKVSGNYVYMVIGEQQDKILGIIEDSIN